jgi:MarR family transcriptional regulator for hemolysin
MASLIRDLLRTTKVLRLHLDDALTAAGGAMAMFAILDAVAVEPGLSQREIAERIAVEGPAVTRQLDHLEAEGLVIRQRDSGDRRILHVTLTPAGWARYATLGPLISAHEQKLLEPFTSDEIAVLAQFLQHIRSLHYAPTAQDAGA